MKKKKLNVKLNLGKHAISKFKSARLIGGGHPTCIHCGAYETDVDCLEPITVNGASECICM